MVLDPLLRAIARERPDGAGVADWSVCATESRQLSLGVKDRQAGNAHTPLRISDSCGARYLLVWEDGKVSRGHLERRQLEAEPERALAVARSAAYEDPDAATVLGPDRFPEVELFAAAAAELARGHTGRLGRRLAEVRRRIAEHRFATWSGSFSAGEAETRLVTSAGLEISGRGTSHGWYVTVNGEIGAGFSARGLEPEAEFEARLDRLMRTALDLKKDGEPLADGVRPVILHPRVVEEYVLDTLLGNLAGATVHHGEGHFRVEDFGSGRAVLREDLSLRLDPLVPLKSGSYRFSTQGVPAAPCAFIERGRLVQPVLDLKYARRMGRAPTPLPYAMDTLHFEGPPPLSLDEALRRAGNGAVVLAVLGVHTQDSASGDFSLSAPQVLRVSEGEIAGRLRATISGNLFELLRTDTLRLVRFEGEHTPGLLIECRIDPK